MQRNLTELMPGYYWVDDGDTWNIVLLPTDIDLAGLKLVGPIRTPMRWEEVIEVIE